MLTLKQIDAYLDNPNTKKALDLLGYTEGTDKLHGYYTNVGGKRITDVSKHPNVIGLRTKEGPSTAFGRYQITNQTFNDIAPKLGITDMSPRNQDRIAIALMDRNGALGDVVQGRFGDAINKLGGTWASLPSSKYSQPKKSWADVGRILGSKTYPSMKDNVYSDSSWEYAKNKPTINKDMLLAGSAKVPEMLPVLPPVQQRPTIAVNTQPNVVPNTGVSYDPSILSKGLGITPIVRNNKKVLAMNTIGNQYSGADTPEAILNEVNPYIGLAYAPQRINKY